MEGVVMSKNPLLKTKKCRTAGRLLLWQGKKEHRVQLVSGREP